MFSDEKILITGPAGRIAFALARSLATDNDVGGIARFSDPATRKSVEALGVKTRTLDIADGQFGDLPTDFSYLLHLAADHTKRSAITGPCRVGWREGFRRLAEQCYPDRTGSP